MKYSVLGIVAGAALLVVPSITSAQSTGAFTRESRVASVGMLVGGDNDGLGIGGSAEWGVMPIGKATLGLGGFAGFQRESDGVGALKVSGTSVFLMGTGNVHFPVASQPRLDLYAGASVGFIRYGAKLENSTANQSDAEVDLGVGIQGGARYRLAGGTNVFGQIGVGDIPLLYGGISFKF